MRIIDIAGVQLVVSDKDYDYYWAQRSIGENSDAFKVACRRLIGLGPDSHSFDFSFIQFHIWGENNKEQCIRKIQKSGLVEYEEEWCKNKPSPQLKGAAYAAQRLQALIQELDDEFEDELEL